LQARAVSSLPSAGLHTMGNTDSQFADVANRASGRVGRIAITGRYHTLPKKLEDDYTIDDKVLGTGINGSVYLAKKGDAKFAVKDFKLRNISKGDKDDLKGECEIFLGMDHPHVARLTDVYETPDKLSLVMECMAGGELFDRVLARERYSEKDAAVATNQMLLAINYLHSQGIVHRDIKLENFLYESKDSDHLKLIDFGFSKIWDPDTKMKMSCGTMAYVAPEVLQKSYTSQCDMWSLGVVVFILLVGYMPFSGSREIAKGEYLMYPDKWKLVSTEGFDYVKKLLVVDPKVRLTAAQALKEQWLIKSMEATPSEVNPEILGSLCSFARESKFRRTCLQAMAWSLSNDERAKVRDAFIAMDTDNNGFITLSEFKQVIQDQFHIEDAKVLEAFDAIDADHDGKIIYSEYLAAMVSSRISMNDELLKTTFSRFDADSDGFVTEQDVSQILGGSMGEGELKSMMDRIDENHDGKISYEELIHYLQSADATEEHKVVGHNVIDRHQPADSPKPLKPRDDTCCIS